MEKLKSKKNFCIFQQAGYIIIWIFLTNHSLFF